MASKKYLLIAFTISAGVAFGVFLFAPVSKTLYIKNSNSYSASAENNTENIIGDLSNTIIPSIKAPKNITENFAGVLAQKLISQNTAPITDISGQSTLATPDVSAMAEEFIKNGLKQANENVLNIKAPDLKISYDNSKPAIEKYLSDTQLVINNNLNSGEPLLSILNKMAKDESVDMGNLLPIISAHEAAANQVEQIPVPSNLKKIMTEEIRLLRITANILRSLTNIEADPLGALAAAKQLEAIIQSWQDIQKEMNIFIVNLNKI